MFDGKKERIIQEFVPGKQVTLAHVIPHPVKRAVCKNGTYRCQRCHRDLYDHTE